MFTNAFKLHATARRLQGALATSRRVISSSSSRHKQSSSRRAPWSAQTMRWRLGALAAFASSTTASAAAAAGKQAATAPIEYHRLDYTPSDFFIPEIFLSFVLDASDTLVTATSQVTRSVSPASAGADLVLDGEDLDLVGVKVRISNVKQCLTRGGYLTLTHAYPAPCQVAGAALAQSAYAYADGKLRIKSAALPAGPAAFELETSVRVRPDKNLALSGLYQSGASLLCTQCEVRVGPTSMTIMCICTLSSSHSVTQKIAR